MRNFPLIILSVLFLLAGCTNGTQMTAIEYNDAIVGEQTKITKLILDLVNHIETDLDKCEELRKQTIEQCDASIKTVEGMSDFEGNVRLKNTALDLFRFYKDISSNEYKEMLDILRKEDGITVEDVDRLGALEQQVGQREVGLDQNFHNAQQEFANKYKLMIQENALQKEVDQMSR